MGQILEIDHKQYVVIKQKNKFSVGDRIEIMKPDGRDISVTVEEIRDEDMMEMESAPHPQQKLYVRLSEDAETYDILRAQESDELRT